MSNPIAGIRATAGNFFEYLEALKSSENIIYTVHSNTIYPRFLSCCTYYHPPQTLSRNKISFLQVEAACCSKLNRRLLFSTNFFNLQQQILLSDIVWGGWYYVQQRFSMLRCKLQRFVARITSPLKKVINFCLTKGNLWWQYIR